ncbi:hypothetical protein OGAPHI_002734 [Ogataea philodendri]|uniref:Uncharacterized protein n=1 Tax=Ogataea philodendri TaxID=1378263 RepID=A0A9P8PCJ5_9ASCO|nr:uncharacterized protein OGAPHI_002734 [Ogataea philodendri]KAH3668979.1 hypothetical protein OGAPHI_002734 [Ogataea philodendri]
MLWAKTSNGDPASTLVISRSPRKSPDRHSTRIWGAFCLIFSTVDRKWCDPPSGKSSLSTVVRTTYPSPHLLMASAVFSGSFGSKGPGFLFVFTEQNRHPLVHVSPINMIVAVASDFFPPQHSPIFGHLASSQTVASFSSLTSFFKAWKLLPLGIGTLSHDGNRASGSFLATSSGSTNISLAFPLTKSSNDGPLFSLSVNTVTRLRLFLGGEIMDSSSRVFPVSAALGTDARNRAPANPGLKPA